MSDIILALVSFDKFEPINNGMDKHYGRIGHKSISYKKDNYTISTKKGSHKQLQNITNVTI